jgi:hypothetical protein
MTSYNVTCALQVLWQASTLTARQRHHVQYEKTRTLLFIARGNLMIAEDKEARNTKNMNTAHHHDLSLLCRVPALPIVTDCQTDCD